MSYTLKYYALELMLITVHFFLRIASTQLGLYEILRSSRGLDDTVVHERHIWFMRKIEELIILARLKIYSVNNSILKPNF